MLFSDNMKKIMLAGIGAVAITAEKSKDMIDEFVSKGELTVEQGKILNEELKHKVKDKVPDSVQIQIIHNDKPKEQPSIDTVLTQMEQMSPEELNALQSKLAELSANTVSEEKNGEK